MARQPNIEAAIRRSRDARAAMQSRRRRSYLAAGVIAVALASGGVASFDALAGDDAVQAAVAQAQSLADLISQRSPGERTAAQLTKTRHAKALARTRARPHVAPPAEVELAKILTQPPAEAPLELASPEPLVSLVAPQPLAGLIVPPSGGGGGGVVSPPGGGGGGGGGVSPPGGGGTETFPNEPREPVPSVPEPGTWALMLLGFGLIGWRARRSRPTLQTA